MDEMKMTGNCLKGSRPVVVFDQQFDEEPHLRLIKEVLSHVSGPQKSPRSSYLCLSCLSFLTHRSHYGT
jgi:ribosome biogenesis protein BRX1